MACPICGKEPDEKYRPFCSRRCADIDLGRWLKGSYVLPRELTEADEGEVDLDSLTSPDGSGRPH
ncbi:DNA gyrase inhibitor YacG [Thioclava sp. BHET1]|nr:DNA gyrase inhibitor YacG [Thioclava sp. BHET1]